MKSLVLSLFLLTMFIGCSDDNGAKYTAIPEFFQLSEDDLLEKTNNDRSEVLENFSQYANNTKYSFDWTKFWQGYLSQLENDQNLDNLDIERSFRIASQYCTENSAEAVLKILFLHDSAQEISDATFRAQQSLLKLCGSKLKAAPLRRLQALNQQIAFAANDAELLSKVEIILSVDDYIQNVLGIFQSSFSSQDIDSVANRLIDSNDVVSTVKLLNIHRIRYPNAKAYRKQLVTKLLSRPQYLKDTIKDAEIETVIQSLEYIYDSSQGDQSVFRADRYFDLLIERFESQYSSISVFSDFSEVYDNLWLEYSRAFNLLKNLKFKNDLYSLVAFNRLYKVVSNSLSISKVDGLAKLSSIRDGSANLALLHELKFQQRQNVDNRYELRDYVSENNDQTKLDRLVINRLNLYKKDKYSVEDYCSDLIQDFSITVQTISPDNVQDVVRRGEIGCYRFSGDVNYDKDKHFSTSINLPRIDLYEDVIFILPDTDVSITTNYYSGGVWKTSSIRTYEQRKLDNLENYNTVFFPIFLTIKVEKNGSNSLETGTYRIAYNHMYNPPRNPHSREEFGFVMKKGVRAGNLVIKRKDLDSIPPLLIASGQLGEPGPNPIAPGQGLSFEMDELLFDSAGDLLKDNRFNIAAPSMAFLRKLHMSNWLEISIPYLELKHFYAKACAADYTKDEVCQVNGHTVEKASLDLVNAHPVNQFESELSIFIRDIGKPGNDDFYSGRFTFPPLTDDKTETTTFLDGEKGDDGELKMERIL